MKNSATLHLSFISRLFRLLADAITGKELNFTEGSIRRSVILLAVPMVLEMAMESIFAVVDIFFVSRWAESRAGSSAISDIVAVVGLTEAMLSILYAVGVGIAMGATAVIARRIGEKKPDEASLAAGQVLWVGLLVSVAIAVIGIFFSKSLLQLMGASQSVLEQGATYTTIMLSGSFTIVYLFLINGVFRGAGNASIAMKSLWLANGINILLDPCLIFGVGPFPEMGVTGAAIATNIGRFTGLCYLLYHLSSGHSQIKLALRHLTLVPVVALSILRVSAFGVFQFFIATTSWVFLMRIMANHGSEAVAGYTIAIRLVILTFLPAWGLSNAAATLVGQNLGAENPQRAEQAVWQTVRYNVIFMFTAAIIYFTFSPVLMRFFTQDAAVIAYGIQCLRVMSLGYIFLAVGTVLVAAFNGSGDTITPTWINFICFWIIQIPLAFVASDVLAFGPAGVFWAITISESTIAVIAYLKFRKGHWKLKKV